MPGEGVVVASEQGDTQLCIHTGEGGVTPKIQRQERISPAPPPYPVYQARPLASTFHSGFLPCLPCLPDFFFLPS